MTDIPEDNPVDSGTAESKHEAPVKTEEHPDRAAQRAAQADRKQTTGHVIWMLLALIVPAVALFFSSRDEVATTIFHSLRLGVTSFFVALAIIGLSQIDKKFLDTKLDAKSRILASMLGVMLWLVWVGSGQMVFKAADETKAGALVEQGSSD